MKLFKLSLYLLIITFLIGDVSCRKSGFGSIEGIVYEAGTNIPISHAKVILSQDHHGNQEAEIDQTYTDNNGHYKIKFYKKVLGWSYYLGASSETVWGKWHKQIDLRKSKADAYLDPFAYIKIRVINNLSSSQHVEVYIRQQTFFLIAKPFQDTLIPTLFEANGNGSTRISGYNPYYFTDNVYINNKGATFIYTINIH